jgi:hypothetical protein
MGHIRRDAGDYILISFVWKARYLSETHTFQWLAWNTPNKWDKNGSLAGTKVIYSFDRVGPGTGAYASSVGFTFSVQFRSFEESMYCIVQVSVTYLFCFFTNGENDVVTLFHLINPSSDDFSEPAFDPIPLNRLTVLFGDGKTNSGNGLIRLSEYKYKQGMSQGTSLLVCVLKIPVFSKSVLFIQPSASRKGLDGRKGHLSAALCCQSLPTL